MYTKFPFSMENIPRQRRAGCLSLRFGAILTALVVILYSLHALSQCAGELATLAPAPAPHGAARWERVLVHALLIGAAAVHSVSFILSAVMLLGALRDKASLIKPWVVWKSVQLVGCVLVFVLWSAMNVVNQLEDGSLLIYVIEFLSILIRLYMLMIVASYYRQLVEAGEEAARLHALVRSTHTWHTDA